MATHTSYTGVKLSELNIEEKGYLSDALKGFWVRKWENNIKLTVVKGHGMLTSQIASEPMIVQLELPQHEPFYLNILSLTGSRTVLIEDNISIVLHPGEQIQAVFTTEV